MDQAPGPPSHHGRIQHLLQRREVSGHLLREDSGKYSLHPPNIYSTMQTSTIEVKCFPERFPEQRRAVCIHQSLTHSHYTHEPTNNTIQISTLDIKCFPCREVPGIAVNLTKRERSLHSPLNQAFRTTPTPGCQRTMLCTNLRYRKVFFQRERDLCPNAAVSFHSPVLQRQAQSLPFFPSPRQPVPK